LPTASGASNCSHRFGATNEFDTIKTLLSRIIFGGSSRCRTGTDHCGNGKDFLNRIFRRHQSGDARIVVAIPQAFLVVVASG
jgi:hypothetical protein